MKATYFVVVFLKSGCVQYYTEYLYIYTKGIIPYHLIVPLKSDV